MSNSLRVSLLLSLASFGACTPLMRLNSNEPFRAADLKLSGDQLVAVHVSVRSGQVTFLSSPNDSIGVQADLVSQDQERINEVCRPNTTLVQDTKGGRTLYLHLEQTSREKCSERWVIALPARLEARAEVFVGDVRVDARVRALEVDLRGPGSVRGNVTSSKVDVDVSLIGDVDLTVVAGDVGRASADSQLGRVALSVRGLNVQPQSRPGRGAIAEVTGSGAGGVTVRTRNGSAALRIE